MRKKVLLSFLSLVVLVSTFYAGYRIGDYKNDSNDQDNLTRALLTKWVHEAEPPYPTVSINGVAIKVVRAGYSWCAPESSDNHKCEFVDAGITDPKPIVVPAGSEIDTNPPEGIKSFNITNTNSAVSDDSYFVPKTKGTYLYHIQSEWFLDQGEANYYFSIEVL